MSFKYQVQKISENHYLLPKCGNMNAEVHAFLSENLYDHSEESCWSQAANAASYPGVTAVYLQPDCHSGFGIPIGCVVVTDDVIIQAGSGYDISCGILHMKTELHASDIAGWQKREDLVREIEKRIATGTGSNRPVYMPKFKTKEVNEILRYGAKALGVDTSLCERQYIEIPDDINLEKIEKAYEKCAPQLGSLGSGNHFLEVQADPVDGSIWIMIHCGSRGFGWQTANHFFFEGAHLRNIPNNKRETSWLRIDEPLGKEYWAHHNAAANYAIANRHIIVNGVKEAVQKIFKSSAEVYYEISHNLVQEETLVLPDGTTKRGFVHRKGATRAFPAGHPDLVGTKWEQTGHPTLIPGSMRDGAAILSPQSGSYKSGCSVNHGSGRIMARGEAKRKLAHKQDFIDDEMHNVKRKFGGVEIRGIVGNSKHTPLDECGHVYKDLDEVLAVLEAENIAKIQHRLYPIANLKGMD